MRTQFIGRNIEITDAMKEYAEKKLQKLNKFFNDNYQIKCLFKTQKDTQTAEFTVYYDGLTFRSEASSRDLYESMDEAIDILVSQIVKQKSRLKRANASIKFTEESSEEKESQENKIVKRKDVELMPMYEDEAILQMELLNHDMFVFLDAVEDTVKVLYRRKDGNYGILRTK